MPRPFSEHPWGSIRAPRRQAAPLTMLEVPVVSPQRLLHARRAFIKPHDWTREAIRHRFAVDDRAAAEQMWQPQWFEVLRTTAQTAAGRLGTVLEVERAPEGVELMEVVSPVAEATAGVFARVRFEEAAPRQLARAIALACSTQLPRTWFRLGPLALLGGSFWRRERGYRLHLRRASDVHIPRQMRRTLGDLLRRGQ